MHKNAPSYIEQILEATPHLPLISETIQLKQTRYARHCCRSKDELVSDVLLWTPSHGHAYVRQPARTYLQYLCIDTVCSLDDLPGAVDDRDRWRERVREIYASSMSWWWWLLLTLALLYIFNLNRSSVTDQGAEAKYGIIFKTLFFVWFVQFLKKIW